jgi:hypothetical protein
VGGESRRRERGSEEARERKREEGRERDSGKAKWGQVEKSDRIYFIYVVKENAGKRVDGRRWQ